MALRVRVDAVSGARERGDKLLRVSFRGVSHTTGALPDQGDDLTVGQTFEWAVARPVESHETLALALLPARPWARRALGQYVLVLQTVARAGRLAVQDALTDERSRPLPGAPADGGVGEPLDGLDEEQQLLVDVEANIANLELGLAHRRSLSLENEPIVGGGGGATPPPRKRLT
ncbi:Uncharacterized protein GBIM_02749 [Gryllus bimaculatus]|nr:Uncharacterized protein GBIM_02749 [Gryllus bimaculatus]